MKRTPEQLKKFVLDTLLPYKNNPTICGWNKSEGLCEYLTAEGNKCAVGKHLKEKPEWQGYIGNIEGMVDSLDKRDMQLDDVLKDEAKGIPIKVWKSMQRWHDELASGGNPNAFVSTLAVAVGLPMDELLITNE